MRNILCAQHINTFIFSAVVSSFFFILSFVSFARFYFSFFLLVAVSSSRITNDERDNLSQTPSNMLRCTPLAMEKCTNGNFLCNFSHLVVHSFVSLLVIAFSSISSECYDDMCDGMVHRILFGLFTGFRKTPAMWLPMT